MNYVRVIALGIAVVGLLTLVDIALRLREHQMNRFAKQFAAVPLYTNGASGILIADRTKDQPLWGIWNFKDGNSVSCFVNGKLVLGFTYVPEGHEETEVNFYGKDGKLISQWKARENGVFYGRTFFDEGGARPQVWLNESWHPVVVRTNQGRIVNGAILDGKWRHLVVTNGVVGVEY